jgi:hypothetical protein
MNYHFKGAEFRRQQAGDDKASCLEDGLELF